MQAMDLNEFIRTCGKARKKRLREENQRKHATTRRALAWDETLPRVVFSITEVAKRLTMPRGELFAWLDANGWIVWNPDIQAWAACDTAVEPGWIATRRKTIGWSSYVYQAVITPAGLAELVRAGIAAQENADGQ